MMETNDHAFMKVNAIVILSARHVTSALFAVHVCGKKKTKKPWMRPLPKSTSFLSVRAVI